MKGTSPPASLLWRLAASSTLTLLFGLFVFGRLKRKFYNYL
jgi:hypothetical protein